MVLPLKNIIYEKINEVKYTTDKDLLKTLIKEKVDVSQNITAFGNYEFNICKMGWKR